MAKILNGIYKPSSGMVSVLGQDVSKRAVRRAPPQARGLRLSESRSSDLHPAGSDEIAYGLKNLELPETRWTADRRALDAVGLTDQDGGGSSSSWERGSASAWPWLLSWPWSRDDHCRRTDHTGQDYRMVCGIMDLLRDYARAGQHGPDHHPRYDPSWPTTVTGLWCF